MAITERQNRIVNEALESMGIDPTVCTREEAPNVWNLHRGKAQIIAVLQESTILQDSKAVTLTIMSPMFKVSNKASERLATYQYILEANHRLTTETFSVSKDWIILSATYYMDDMSLREVRQLIDGLSFHAQQFLAYFTNEEETEDETKSK